MDNEKVFWEGEPTGKRVMSSGGVLSDFESDGEGVGTFEWG